MLYYHGSAAAGLSILTPFLSEHHSEYVYFSTNPVVAAFYTVRAVERPYNWFPYGFDTRKIPVYTEYYPNALQDAYGGKPGFLYACTACGALQALPEIPTAYVSEAPVPVSECVAIPDMYQWFLEQAGEGKFILRPHADLTQTDLAFAETMIREEIKKHRLVEAPRSGYAQFLAARFPEVWAEAKKALDIPNTMC